MDCTRSVPLYIGWSRRSLPSTFERDLVLRSTMYWNVRANIRSEFNRVVLIEVNYSFTIFFPHVAHVFYWIICNLLVLQSLEFQVLANLALSCAILIILQVYILRFSQFRPSLWPFFSTLIKDQNWTKSKNVKLIFFVPGFIKVLENW